MSFKKLLLFVFSFLITSCGLEIGERPAPEGEVRMDGYACVNQISEKVGEYFEGEMSDEKIIDFVDCLKKSVSDFTKRVRRRAGEDFYDPEDLRAFINKIAKKRELSVELLTEFMKIKQTFVGGRVDRISKKDLASALNLLEDIKTAALILKPHLKIFNASLASSIPPERIAIELDQSQEALSEVLRIFLTSLRTTEGTYSLKDFETFMEEFRHFIKWYDVFPNGRPAKEWIELVASLKEITTGGDRYLIGKNEWDSFLNFGRSAYMVFLKVKYGVSGQDLLHGVGLKNLIHVVDQTRDELTKLISSRKDRMIPRDEVRRLLDSMDKMSWLPFGLSSKVWANAIELFISKLLERGQGSQFAGYRVSHVLKLSDEFEGWASTQDYISNHVLRVGDPFGAPPQIFLGSGFPAQGLTEQVPVGWTEYRKFMSARRPLFLPDSSMVALTYQNELSELGVEYDLHNLSLTLIFYRAVRLVYKAYGIAAGGGNYYIGGQGLQEFYTDFFDIGVALKWLDSRNRTAGSRSYVEGNLFTYSANGMYGDSALNLSEGVDLIAYLLSAGTFTDQMYKKLYHCNKGPIDFRGARKLQRSCVRNGISFVLENEAHFAPRLQEWLSEQPLEQRLRYSNLLLDAAFAQKSSDNEWVEKAELSTISVIILYTETVLTRFDLDQNGQLSNEEVNLAFPIFKDFINSLAKGLANREHDYSEKEVRAIYKFILSKRRAPDTSSTADLTSLYLNSWASDPYADVNSDRMALTESFSVIINRLLNVESVP